MNKYDLILCELYHPVIHGKTDDSAINIESHYLVLIKTDIIDIRHWIRIYSRLYRCYIQRNIFQNNNMTYENTIRNFAKIISNKKIIYYKNMTKYEIMESLLLLLIF